MYEEDHMMVLAARPYNDDVDDGYGIYTFVLLY
jgi:hypothetical protein